MTASEKAKVLTVVVNGGSGVLFQPMTDQYTYVLTAKHNIWDEKGAKLLDMADIDILRFGVDDAPRKLSANNIYPSENYDAVIIKVDRQTNIPSIGRKCTIVELGTEFNLYGYPATRRSGEKYEINYIYGKVRDINGEIIVCQPENFPVQGMVEGFSGGGIFEFINEENLLIGIQFQMNARTSIEDSGKIDSYSLMIFDDIIKKYGDESLVPLYPSYLSDFSQFIDKVFPLTGFSEEEKILLTRNVLKDTANSCINGNINPKAIVDEYSDKFLIDGETEEVIFSQKLWIVWLEYLTITRILEEKNIDNINEINNALNTNRLLYSNTEQDWGSILYKIVKSNLLDLKRGGAIIVSTNAAVPTFSSYPSEKLINIADTRGITSSHWRIDTGIKFSDYSLMHINIFQREAILVNEDKYEKLKEDEIKSELKKDYENIIRAN